MPCFASDLGRCCRCQQPSFHVAGRRPGAPDLCERPGPPGKPPLAHRVDVSENPSSVLVIRPTQVLAQRLKVDLQADAEGSTLLRDWYCHLLRVGRRQLVLAVSEEARLPVLLPVAGQGPFETRLVSSVGDILRAIGVDAHVVAEEVARMSPVAYAKSRSRSVLGSIRDFTNLAAGYLETTDNLLDVALKLADAPCGPLRMRTPRDVAREILSGTRA